MARLVLVAALALAVPAMGGELVLVTDPAWIPGRPLTIRVELRTPTGALDLRRWDATARLSSPTPGVELSVSEVALRNGIGSARVGVETRRGEVEPESMTLEARIGELGARRAIPRPIGLSPGNGPGPPPITGERVRWSGVLSTGSFSIPEGTTLELAPGTVVRMVGESTCATGFLSATLCGASIEVRGALEILGTADRPVMIRSAPAAPWGGIHHVGGGRSIYRHAILTGGGRTPPVGHTDRGAMIRVEGAGLELDHVMITDSDGLGIHAVDSRLGIRDTLIARTTLGIETERSALTVERSAIQETRSPDDADGLYLVETVEGRRSIIRSSVVAASDDDGIDTRDAEVRIEGSVLRDHRDKGLSVDRGSVRVIDTFVVDNRVGVAAKGLGTTGARVAIERCTLVGNEIGLEIPALVFSPRSRVSIEVDRSIVWDVDAIRAEGAEASVRIESSAVSERWPGDGNVFEQPTFVDAYGHDLRLAPDSAPPDIGVPDPPRASTP